MAPDPPAKPGFAKPEDAGEARRTGDQLVTRVESKKRQEVPLYGKGFIVGMAVGVTLAGAFNPVDKALYLMVLKRRPFLTPKNWERPFEGLSQALLVRTLSGGLFFPLFDLWHDILHTCGLHQGTSVVAGQLTGASIAIFMNPFNAVKYKMWGKTKLTAREMAVQMYRKRGLSSFLRGIHVTVGRDTVFGGVYAGARIALQRSVGDPTKQPPLSINLCAASMAVGLSSPLNYARNIQFGAPGNKPPSVPETLRLLAADVAAKRREVGGHAAAGYLQQRLGLGWGTVRVGVGMALGQQLYDLAMYSA